MSLAIPGIASAATDAELTFDRSTGLLGGATIKERLLALAFRAGARISSAWSYRGFAAGCKLLRPLCANRTLAVRLNNDAIFSFPFGDGYWSLLLDRNYSYERDIDLFFRGIADADYTLIDCGANFGYWSTLVSSRGYGSHRSVAIEPSSSNFAVLKNNALVNGSRFALLQNAIGASSGTARLSGAKHEAMTIAGDSESGEEVGVIPLDSLFASNRVSIEGRYVIKLDVEGVEIEALKGASQLLRTDCIVICEEHGNDANHTISRYILGHTLLKLFCFDPATGRFERLENVSSLDRIKSKTNFGYNVLATASSFWEKRLAALSQSGKTGNES